MNYCPEMFDPDRSEMGVVWQAGVKGIQKSDKRYREIDVKKTLHYLRRYMNGESLTGLPDRSNPMLTVHVLTTLFLGTCRINMAQFQDEIDEVRKLNKKSKELLTPKSVDQPIPSARRKKRLQMNVTLPFGEEEDSDDEIERLLGFSVLPMAEFEEQLTQLPQAELSVGEFFPEELPPQLTEAELLAMDVEQLPHTVPREQITMPEVLEARAVTPPCDHEHERDEHFHEDFGQAIDAMRQIPPPAPRPPSSTSTSTTDVELPLPPPPREPRRRIRRIQRPALNLEDLLAALPPLPVDELVRDPPLVRNFLHPDQLFPIVDELVWLDVNGMMMPFFPPIDRDAVPREAPLPVLHEPEQAPEILERAPELLHEPDLVPEMPLPGPELIREPDQAAEMIDRAPELPELMREPDQDLEMPLLEPELASEPQEAIAQDQPVGAVSPPSITERLRRQNNLIRLIQDFINDNPGEPILFRTLVPPTRFNKTEASTIFGTMLDLHKMGVITVNQDDPRADIVIYPLELSTSGESSAAAPSSDDLSEQF